MSTISVEVVEIASVTAHPNADRLDLITFKGMGWQCVSQRGKFQPGQRAVYFPIDSVLPDALMQKIFSGDGKTSTPSGGRIRTIRLRGLVSQGLVVRPEEIGLTDTLKVGTDLTETLGVKKYEPPKKGTPGTAGKAKPLKKYKVLHEKFSRYTDIEHIQKHKWMLEEVVAQGTEIAVHEKVHGTSARFGWLKKTGMWQRIRGWFGLAPQYVYLMGSRKIDMSPDYEGPVHHSLPRGVYKEVSDNWNLRARIPYGVQVYGEIIGHGVQPGYFYGIGEGQLDFLVYDVRDNERWLDDWEIDRFCKTHGFRRVPFVYRGSYQGLERIIELAQGPSIYAPKAQPVREGVVVRPVKETTMHGQRLLFKYVSADFLTGKHAETEIPDNE